MAIRFTVPAKRKDEEEDVRPEFRMPWSSGMEATGGGLLPRTSTAAPSRGIFITVAPSQKVPWSSGMATTGGAESLLPSRPTPVIGPAYATLNGRPILPTTLVKREPPGEAVGVWPWSETLAERRARWQAETARFLTPRENLSLRQMRRFLPRSATELAYLAQTMRPVPVATRDADEVISRALELARLFGTQQYRAELGEARRAAAERAEEGLELMRRGLELRQQAQEWRKQAEQQKREEQQKKETQKRSEILDKEAYEREKEQTRGLNEARSKEIAQLQREYDRRAERASGLLAGFGQVRDPEKYAQMFDMAKAEAGRLREMRSQIAAAQRLYELSEAFPTLGDAVEAYIEQRLSPEELLELAKGNRWVSERQYEEIRRRVLGE